MQFTDRRLAFVLLLRSLAVPVFLAAICGMALSVLVYQHAAAILLRNPNSCASCICEDQAEVKLFCVGFVSLLFVLLHGLSALAWVPFSHPAVALAPFRLHRALPRWFVFGSKAT